MSEDMPRQDFPAQRLRQLAAADAAAGPPYDYETFRRRAESAGSPRPAVPRAAVALAASVAALLFGAVLWQRLGAGVDAGVAAVADVAPVGAGEPDGPALVRVSTHWRRAELEDQIALLDALLSEARLEGADGSLESLKARRLLLADSLQSVARADALLASR